MKIQFKPNPKPTPTEKKKRTPIRKVSKKRQAEEAEYKKVRAEYLSEHPKCEVKGCGKFSSECHHKMGRIGGLLTDKRFFLAVCRTHHTFIELNPEWAKENKYSLNRI